jgi:excisionase family DNA binding protein
MLKTYTVEEAAEICKASNDTIYAEIDSLKLKASRIGRNYVIKEVDLDRFIDAKSLANLRAKECQSKSEAIYGIATLKSQDSQELDVLLKPKTNEKRKKGMTNLSIIKNA